ncbi:MAG: carboxypeptidase regulatory-like domain-containing protein [Pyrinomonadaceae bacterium]
MKDLLFVFLILISAPIIFSAPGDLDTTFGISGGYVVSDFLGGQVDERPYDVAVQTDGKIIVAGNLRPGGNDYDYLVARYNTDGTLDTTFSTDGIFTLNEGLTTDVVNALVIQTDGKIVAVGENDAVSQAYIFRLNTDGTLDTSFDGDGIVEITSAGIPLSVALQTNGKIVVGTSGLSDEAIILRLNTNGTLDTTFDTDGRVSLSPHLEFPHGLAIQANGRIIVAGTSSSDDFSTVRLLSSGTLDTSFDGDGIAVTAIYAVANSARSVAIQANGRILVGGGGDSNVVGLVRYNANGSLDTSFDADGIKTFQLKEVGNPSDYIEDLAIQPDGKILAIADTTYNILNRFIPESFTLFRFNEDGSFDTSFDGNGVARSQWCEYGKDLFLQTDGKIAAIGIQERPVQNGTVGFCTQRFNADGSVDTSLNFQTSDGRMKQTVLSIQDFTQVEAVAGLPNGKILVAGWGEVPGQSYDTAKLIRLNADGTPDTTFMDEGVFEYRDGTASTYFNDLKILSDGSFLVAGEASLLGGVIAKFTPTGVLDTTFSGDGIAVINVISRIYSLTVQTDGKIIGCGSNGSGVATRNGKIIRLSATGTLELDGSAIVGSGNNEIFECGLQSTGKLILAGYGNDGTSDYVAVSRRLSNFGADTTFGTNGTVTTDLSTTLNDRATDLVIQPNDNKIVVSSMGLNGGGDRDFAVLRYDANGITLDPNLYENFGTGGISLINFGGTNPNDEANALLLQPDGQIIVGGLSDDTIEQRFGVAKLNSDGSLRLSFGTLGRAVTPFPNGDAQISALGLYTNGRILAAGTNWNGTDYDFALVRYENEFIPTAATVSVSGRVSTANGRGIRNVNVSLLASNGSVLTTRTSTFGYFRFDEIEVGETYVITVSSKRFTFGQASQLLSVNDELTNVDFVAEQ